MTWFEQALEAALEREAAAPGCTQVGQWGLAGAFQSCLRPAGANLSTRRDVSSVNPCAQNKGSCLDFCHMALSMAQSHAKLPLDVFVAPGKTQNLTQFHTEQKAHPKLSMAPTQHPQVWLTPAALTRNKHKI